MNKLHFELYAYGDPYLKAIVGDSDDSDRYFIEQADKFEVRFCKENREPGVPALHLGYYDTIYEALDAANNHYENKLAEEDKGAPQADKYVMPERAELEVFEDNQPSDRPPCRLYGQTFDPVQTQAIIDARKNKVNLWDFW